MSVIKQVRMHIDHLLIQSDAIGKSRELALAYTNLQRGQMWLGKVLQEQGEANPYPESTNINSDKIEERTDQAKDNPATGEGIPSDNKIAQVKWMRNQIDINLSEISNTFSYPSLRPATEALQEAKMWYGQELNNILQAQKSN